MNDEKLIGWLCWIRMSFSMDMPPVIPPCVTDALIAKGWFSAQSEDDWQGRRSGTITPAGWALTDLHGPEWGINTIPEDSTA